MYKTLFFSLLAMNVLFSLVLLCRVLIRKHKKIKTEKTFIPPVLTDWDRKCMAFHEAGHAVCSYFLPEREPLLCITVDPSHKAFGMVRTAKRPHHNETAISLRSLITTLLAGKIAEKHFLGIISTSCIHDLNAAVSIAKDMVLKFGMGKQNTYFVRTFGNSDIPDLLDDVCREDIRTILDECGRCAEELLKTKHDLVIELSQILLEKKKVDQQEINCFFQTQK